MKDYSRNSLKISLILALLLAGVAPLRAQSGYNGWNTTNSGKWEVGTNWYLGTPPGTNDLYDNIFDGTGITVTIDAVTSGNFPNTMKVNNVGINAPAVTLLLNNAGTNVPLHILNSLDISGYGNAEVVVTNSALQVDGMLFVGDQYNAAASLELDSGSARIGAMSLGNGGYGHLNLNGGTMTLQGSMTLGVVATDGGGGNVQMFGGTLTSSNNPIYIGSNGFGGFVMYGGSVRAQGFQVGGPAASAQGQLFVEGGTALVSSDILVGNSLVTNLCSVTVASNSYYGTFGTLIVTNAARTAHIDVAQNGSLTLNGGLLEVDNLILTNGGTFVNQSGTFELVPPLDIDNGGSVVLAGSTNDFESGVQLGSTTGGTGSLTVQPNTVMNVISNLVIVSSSLTSTSSVTLNGGSLIMSNGVVKIGPAGSGQMIVTGGNHVVRQLLLGSSNSLGSGFFHMSGGYVKILGTGTGPGQGLISNWIIVDGGDLDGSGTSFTVGDAHSSDAFLAGNGTASFANGYVGYTPGYTGNYNQTNGTMTISSGLTVGTGDCMNGAVGELNLYGGGLYVTNATHTAVLTVLNGTVVVNAGATLVADNLVLTSPCGHFMKKGGTVNVYNPPTLDPNLDADGNGESNGYKAAAGLDPLDPSSVFEVISVAVTNGTDLNLVWTTEGGHSYVVQSNGNLMGTFNDLSDDIEVGGTGPGTTNYVIRGAAASHAVFYRVRLGP